MNGIRILYDCDCQSESDNPTARASAVSYFVAESPLVGLKDRVVGVVFIIVLVRGFHRWKKQSGWQGLVYSSPLLKLVLTGYRRSTSVSRFY